MFAMAISLSGAMDMSLPNVCCNTVRSQGRLIDFTVFVRRGATTFRFFRPSAEILGRSPAGG